MSFVKDKVALVTGGANGIGLAIVKQLLEHNVKGVTVVDFSESNWNKSKLSLEPHKNKILFIKADVSNDEQLKDAFEKTVHKFQNLDIVVNNAGIVDEENWKTMVSINLNSVIKGTYLALKEYLPKYKSGSEAVIMNTSSVMGINTVSTLAVYCATKHGVVGFAKAIAQQDIFKASNIRLITFCPGLIDTNIFHRYEENVQKEITRELYEIVETTAPAEYVGDSVLKLMNEAKHGSVWVIEDSLPPYEVTFPNKRDLAK